MDINHIYIFYWTMLMFSGVSSIFIGIFLLKRIGVGLGVLCSAVFSGIGVYLSIQWFLEKYRETMGGTIGEVSAIALPVVVYPIYIVALWLLFRWIGKRSFGKS